MSQKWIIKPLPIFAIFLIIVAFICWYYMPAIIKKIEMPPLGEEKIQKAVTRVAKQKDARIIALEGRVDSLEKTTQQLRSSHAAELAKLESDICELQNENVSTQKTMLKLVNQVMALASMTPSTPSEGGGRGYINPASLSPMVASTLNLNPEKDQKAFQAFLKKNPHALPKNASVEEKAEYFQKWVTRARMKEADDKAKADKDALQKAGSLDVFLKKNTEKKALPKNEKETKKQVNQETRTFDEIMRANKQKKEEPSSRANFENYLKKRNLAAMPTKDSTSNNLKTLKKR